MSDDDTTVVIFRKFKDDSSIIALFPYEPGDTVDPYSCKSFMHLGQHGPASMMLMVNGSTTPAKPDEYAALKRELEAQPYGYKLDVRQRTPHDDNEVRRAKLRENGFRHL